MKYLKYVLVILCGFVLININVNAASSKFEPILDLETEIIDDQLFVILGYRGESILALTQEIGYQNDYLELNQVTELSDFKITQSKAKYDGSYTMVKILADSDKVYDDVKFAILTFDLKDKFKVGSSTTIFLYNYDAVGPKKDKYRHKGYELEVKREASDEAMFLKRGIDENTKTKFWFFEHIYLFIFIFLGIVMVIIFIFLIPSKRKTENRSKEIKKTIDNKKNTIAPIKLDVDMIASLGEEKKEVDMSEAIEVSDVKPFGDSKSRFDSEALGTDPDMSVSADVFAMEATRMKDIEDEDEVEKLDNDDNDIDRLGVFILLLIGSGAMIMSVHATEYDIDGLKNNIVNDLKYEAKYDYNNDKKIDLLDLLETKDLTAIEGNNEEEGPTYEPLN